VQSTQAHDLGPAQRLLQDRMVPLSRIRAAMKEVDAPMLDGTVEMDETYVGGKQRHAGRGKATTNKEVVIGIRQRGGDVRFFHAEDARKEHWQSTSKKTSAPMWT